MELVHSVMSAQSSTVPEIESLHMLYCRAEIHSHAVGTMRISYTPITNCSTPYSYVWSGNKGHLRGEDHYGAEYVSLAASG